VEALTLGSRIAVMKGGVLQQLGTPDEVYNTPANTFVASFIGSPTMNLVDGVGQGNSFAVQGAQLGLTVPASLAGKNAQLGLRPEHLSLSDSAAWRGVVSLVEPTGADTYVDVKTDAGELVVRCAPGVSVKPGDPVGLQIAAHKACWFDRASGERCVA
jgi:multiple sugar transport system ATP-binding protein